MKRFLILLLLLGLIVGSVATAEAKKRRKATRIERTVEGSYDTQFVPFGGLVTQTCANTHAKGCVVIETRPNEGYFTARVVDAHGQPVLVTVTDIGPSGPVRTYDTFCGETEEPIPFEGGVTLGFSPGYWDPYLPTPWTTCPPGFGTTGTVSVTLSNLP